MSRGLSQDTFAGWTNATSEDIDILTEQLGRRPAGVLNVAKRCRFGRPQVIVNAPVRIDRTGKARPFPTLFWLTCPYLVKAVGALEGEGWVDRMRQALEESEALAQAMVRAHAAHAELRMSLCDEDVAKGLSPDERKVLETSGVGGMRRPNGVKCLHMHLADYLGRLGKDGVNVVGRETAGLLLQSGVDLDGRPNCSSCSGCKWESNRPLTAIDVGSNSVRMLVATVVRDERGNPAEIHVVDSAREVTRLGDALTPSGFSRGLQDGGGKQAFSKQSKEATLEAIARFAERAQGHGTGPVLGVATAAAREAADAREFLTDVWERSGVSLRAISGREEAELAFAGAMSSLGGLGSHRDDEEVVTVVDVGGGSTEVVSGDASGRGRWSVSVPVGAVRLTKEFASSLRETKDPQIDTGGEGETELAAVSSAMYQAARGRLAQSGLPPHGERTGQLVAVGGTATSLAAIALGLSAYDPKAIQGARIGRADVEALLDKLSAMSPAERLQTPGLEPDRADIIPAGLAILKALMDLLEANEVTVSDGGVQQGVIWAFCHGLGQG